MPGIVAGLPGGWTRGVHGCKEKEEGEEEESTENEKEPA